LIRYTAKSETRITRGENAGNTFAYANVVNDWKILSEWDGREPFSMTADLDADAPVVILLQRQTFGPILAAARLR
jgi:hypothetical protein